MTDKQPDARIDVWKTRYASASSNQQKLFKSFQRWYDDFYAVYRGEIAPWRSKVVDPKIASKTVAVISKLALTNPEPNIIPNDIHDFIKAKNNEQLLKYQLNNPHFDQPIFFKKYSVLCDAAVTGTGLALLPWKHITKKYMSRRIVNGKVVLDEDVVKETKIGYNDFIPVSIFRVFIEPGATSLHEARWVIIEDWKTPEEIKKMHNKYEVYENLDQLDKVKSDGENSSLYEQSRNRLINRLEQTQNGDDTTKKVRLWHCYDRLENSFITIAGEQLVIRSQENIYWHGKFPGVAFYIRPRAHDFWGDGLFERTERLGAANNTIINHFLDQLDVSLNGMVLRKSDVFVDADLSPGGEIVWEGSEKPEAWAVPQPDAGGFQVARQVISEAIEENTISNYELGVPRSSTDKTAGTKGGIAQIQEAAGDMMRFFEMCYSTSCKDWYQMWMSNNQELLDHDIAVRILGPNGYMPKVIKPEDICTQGTLDVVIDVDAMRPRSKEEDRELKLAWIDRQLNIYNVAMNTGVELKLNFYEISRTLGEAMGIKEIDRVLEPLPTANDSPTTENQLLLQGRPVEPRMEEDHDTHIFIHNQLMSDAGIDDELKFDFIVPHIQMHQEMLQQIKDEQGKVELEQLMQLRNETAMLAGGGLGMTPDMMGTQGGQDVPLSPEATPQQPQNQPPVA